MRMANDRNNSDQRDAESALGHRGLPISFDDSQPILADFSILRSQAHDR
jgi:hypothetical protein